jgi:Bacterial Ig-like domain
MDLRKYSGCLLIVLAALAAEGCNGFGTNCSTNADCQAQNPEAVCDPTLKVCFVFSGPTVTGIQPANLTSGVAPDNAQVVATFSEPIVDAGPTTFLVNGQGFDTFGSYLVNAASNQVTFLPLASGLALGTNYTVSLTAGISDAAGTALLPFTSTFSTTDGTFGAGGTLRFTTSNGSYTFGGNYFGSLVIAIDLYITGTVTDFGLAVGVFDAGTNPNTSGFTFLQNQVGQEVDLPSAAIAPSGNALVAWTSSPTPTDGGNTISSFNAHAANYDGQSHTWGGTVTLNVAGPDSTPQFPQVVAFDGANGSDGLAVFLNTVGTIQAVWGSYHKVATGWSVEFPIQSDDTLNASAVSISADYQGNVLVAWQSAQTSGPAGIFAAYLGIDGTDSETIVLSNPELNSVAPVASLGVSGLGAVVWAVTSLETDGGTQAHVVASTFDPARNPSFSAPVQLDSAPSFADFPQVGVSSNGNAFAIWQEPGKIVSSQFIEASNTWGPPVTLDSDPVKLLNGPSVAVDPGGNAVANWVRVTQDAGYQLFGGRYTQDAGWHGQQQITNVGTDPVQDIQPAMTVDAQGRTVTLEERQPTNSQYIEFIPFH